MAAGFDHYTSRAQDPQVHTHVVAINRVYTEGGWRAIDGQRVYAHAKAGGTIYEAKLRLELTRRLGLSWGPVVNGIADIKGFSPELIRHSPPGEPRSWRRLSVTWPDTGEWRIAE